ncbi:PREDICTED: lecithin-cholesterol acyltransferase-like 1 [Tarenaya hassleriana]|uniref:lecithin-cholesterol acyltransferase-like 1 n=1 Tax=Tarenaya hassleriana TaxID=28532 RepID=UPI00053C8474|nr:PREDICTED: lecithin-cholesterol acyltransferase-like 1 [Tarenaya hassleriana]
MTRIVTMMALALSTATMLSTCRSASNLHPVILVPGNGGNQLEARLNREYNPSSLWCSRFLYGRDDWFRLWFDPTVVLDPFTRCFNDRMMLFYDRDLDDYRNAPGVLTRVLDFGSTKSMLYLNPYLKKLASYMSPLVKALEKVGYINDKNIVGAPYDFRYGLAAEGHPSKIGSQFLQDLKDLIEKTSRENDEKPVILISHSLGGLFVLQLLNRNPNSWRDKYIKHFIALAAPWGGTIEQMKTFASGNTLGLPLANPLLVRPSQRSSESNQWLLPSPKIFHDLTNPLVVTPRTNYTAYDMVRFLEDIGFDNVGPYKTRVLPLTEELRAPHVPVTCMYGRNVDTPEVLVYGEGGFDEQPEIVYGDGDGTVNLASLSALETIWVHDKDQSLKTVQINDVSHTSILKDDVAIEEIVKEILNVNSMESELKEYV